jgi:hypothetical protein
LRNDLAKCFNHQSAAELAFGLNLTYRETQEVAPLVRLSELALESMPEEPPPGLSERYCG